MFATGLYGWNHGSKKISFQFKAASNTSGALHFEKMFKKLGKESLLYFSDILARYAEFRNQNQPTTDLLEFLHLPRFLWSLAAESLGRRCRCGWRNGGEDRGLSLGRRLFDMCIVNRLGSTWCSTWAWFRHLCFSTCSNTFGLSPRNCLGNLLWSCLNSKINIE